MSHVSNAIRNIKSFSYTSLNAYNKDIQHILDHFAAGKLESIISIFCIQVEKCLVPVGFVKTSKGTYVFIELPTELLTKRKILQEIDNTLKLDKPVYVQKQAGKVEFAHIGFSYIALRHLE